jgi:hypothetical protein
VQANAFSTLNAYRLAAGVGEVAQDPHLDTSAQAHAQYLLAGTIANTLGTTSLHDEVQGNPDYYGATPLARAELAGVPSTEWVGEDVAPVQQLITESNYGPTCINSLLDTVYHLGSLLSSVQTVGIGFDQGAGQLTASGGLMTGSYCVLDFGETTNVNGTPIANGILIGAGQQMPSTAIAHAPLSNETGLALGMAAESTNPAPDIAAPGHPVLVQVNAAQPGDVLTVSSFTLTAADGTVVPARIIVPSAAVSGSTAAVTADPNGIMLPGVAVLLPLALLTANTTYKASFSGARDGAVISATWTFTTGTESYPWIGE